MLQQDKMLWTAKLPYVELAINANPNASILKPAFEVLYGENVPMPVDYALAKPDGVHSSAAKLRKHSHHYQTDSRCSCVGLAGPKDAA